MGLPRVDVEKADRKQPVVEGSLPPVTQSLFQEPHQPNGSHSLAPSTTRNTRNILLTLKTHLITLLDAQYTVWDRLQ